MKNVIALICSTLSSIKSNVKDLFGIVNSLDVLKNTWVSKESGNIVISLTKELNDEQIASINALFTDTDYELRISSRSNADRDSMNYLNRVDSECLIVVCQPTSIDDLLSC